MNSLVSIILIFGITLFAQETKPSNESQNKLDYLNTNLPLEKRVDNLVSKLTLDEKISQMVFDAPAIPIIGNPFTVE